MFHQAVARQPSVYQARARERNTMCSRASTFQCMKPKSVSGHSQPNTVAEETKLAGRTLHHLTTFEHAGQVRSRGLLRDARVGLTRTLSGTLHP